MPASIHEHPEEWLASALADGLSPGERRALDEHLAGCAQCRALQADLAALDETLLREFPAAVGPAPGFEARLVAGFRRRRGGERLARLRALLGWLVRQRGMQVAGVAAALAGLTWLGQTLTGIQRQASFVANDARIIDGAIDQSAIENNMKSSGQVDREQLRLSFKPNSRVTSTPVGPAERYAGSEASSTPSALAFNGVQVLTPSVINQPVFSTKRGAEVTDFDGFINYGSPIQTVTTNSDGIARSGETITGANTFTGGTTITGGDLAVTGTAKPATSTVNVNGLPSLTLLDGRRIADSAPTFEFNKETSSSEDDPARPKPASPPSPNAAPVGDAPAPAATPAPPDVRKLIRHARAELEVAAFDAAVDAITAAAARDGGFLDTRNSTRGGNGKVNGVLVVKVLPENLDRFLAGLRALGDLKNQTVQTEDVTKDYFDTDARLRNSRRMEDRLLKMLDEVKGKMSEVLQVEKELARVRAEIETMQGQLKFYDAQVRYATVTLNVYERDLRQPAAFLLRENATLALLTADVEKTAAETRRIADAAHVQTLRSELSRDSSNRTRATLRLLIAPEASPEVIAQIKSLGRVENFHVQDDRTAQNGVTSDAAGTDSAKVERAPVTLDLTISHDEQISRQISFTLVAADAEAVFEKARAAAQANRGEIVNSNVARTQDGHASATLGIRVPATAQAALITMLQSLGRAGELETRRVGNGLETSADAGPVLIQLSIVDAEPAVQLTTARVQTSEVERGVNEIKREAAASHVEVESSDFSSGSDGAQHAELRFRLPMSAYADFMTEVRALGAVKDFTVERKDRPGKSGEKAEAGAPVVVALSLYSEGRIVRENSGLGTTLRRTFGQGAGALMWSVRMIGVALAFLAPWTVLSAVVAFGIRWSRRRAKARSTSDKTS